MLIGAQDLVEVGPVDVCIVGGGAAGITLARSFVGTRWRVLLLESGGPSFDARTHALYDTPVIGTDYPIEASRLRYFGGTTNHWAGQSRPLDPIDFEERTWIPHSGWPIGHGDLEPWLDDAHTVCGLGPPEYDPHRWSTTLGPDFLTGSPTLESRIFQLSTPIVRFAAAYGDELAGADNVLVALGANASELLSDQRGQQITGVRVRWFDSDHTAEPRALAYVLACGAIENARLLLASNAVRPAGIGNDFDNVGRYFMEHPAYRAQRMLATPLFPSRGLDWTPSAEPDPPAVVIRAIGPSDAAVRRHELLRSMLIFYGRDDALGDEDADVAETEASVRAGLWRDDPSPTREVAATSIFEQAPNPDSRIRLSEQRDALGNRKAELDWQLGEIDRDSVYRSTILIGEELARLGLARTQLRPWVSLFERPLLPGVGNHHIGTTRMSATSATGVVNRNCRVHDVDNLYVAGSSIFPTGGIANPTMNLVAFALRLADHIKQDAL